MKDTTSTTNQQQTSSQITKMNDYYRFQSKIYDSTRWAFLFGRDTLLENLPELSEDAVILEVGCGTGYNLTKLAQKFPKNKIYGIDVSKMMLEKAEPKIKNFDNISLIEGLYAPNNPDIPQKVDVILFSYSLSMINPGAEELIAFSYEQLNEGGIIGVIDFGYTQKKWFEKHMAKHHVKLGTHLNNALLNKFQTKHYKDKAAYGGVWHYFVYVGNK